jgi:glutamate racemase
VNISVAKITSSSPIGIFDSGVGGLTVFKEVRKFLPLEDVIYLGDTARVPYGTKSVDVVKKYSKQNVEFLLSKGVKIIVVACNTASAASITYLNDIFPDVSIIGVIDPVVEYIRSNLSIKSLGIIGTTTTIESDAYQKALRKYIPNVKIFSKACPLFVPLVEEGLFEDKITEMAVDMYLSAMRNENIDAIILGCTHYPMLKIVIEDYFKKRAKVLDTALHTALALKNVLTQKNLLNSSGQGRESFYVTDSINTFKKTAEMFLGFNIDDISHI